MQYVQSAYYQSRTTPLPYPTRSYVVRRSFRILWRIARILHHFLHACRDFGAHRRQSVRVGLQRQRNLTVPEQLLDDARVDVGSQQQ